MAKYDLSVAIIFKDEIRCLERCLKSLQPLRERLSAQVVMADTGSTDGSRAIAERYADVLFDFPWVGDFSAARNATLDRCRGRWTLVLDSDEWLGENTDELALFLRGRGARRFNCAYVTVRNYSTAELNRYQDFSATRLLRMDDKPRYKGSIHETPRFASGSKNALLLSGLILHHDGYVMLNDGSEAGREKRARNVALLRRELEKEPESLRRMMQFIESGKEEPDIQDVLRRATERTKAKKGDDWRVFGPAIFREALLVANNRNMPEWDEWAAAAYELFPDSYFMRLDGNCLRQHRAYFFNDYEECAFRAEEYLRARADLRDDAEGRLRAQAVARLGTDDEGYEAGVRLNAAESYLRLGRPERAVALLGQMPWRALGEEDARRAREALARGKNALAAAALSAAETPEEADAALAATDDLTALPAEAFVRALKLGAEFPASGRELTGDEFAALADKLRADPPFLREAAKFAASAARTEREMLWAYALAKAALDESLPKEESNG